MENVKQQLKKIAESLQDEQKKQALLAKINSVEVSQELIDEVGQAVEDALDYYQNEVVKVLEEADAQIDAVMDDYQKTLKDLSRQENKANEEKSLEEARKQISQQ